MVLFINTNPGLSNNTFTDHTQTSFSPKYLKWAAWCLFNLLLVAIAGFIVRSKIIFPLSFIHQKNFLHGHSHFAFSGWVSAALMATIVAIVYPGGAGKHPTRLFNLQMIASYGMLLSFPFMGYKLPSIFFSTVTILVSWIFTAMMWKPISQLPDTVSPWIRTALLLNVFSALGTFSLAYLMSSGSHSQELTIGSLYLFLHFQYNGWFLFCCAGLFFHMLEHNGRPIKKPTNELIRRLLTIAVIPGFCLSVIWMKIPGWVYSMAVFAALMQLVALAIFLKAVKRVKFQSMTVITKFCLLLSFAAVSLKFLLQALSCIPSLSLYAFGNRSLVIAFLHLVLLGFVSLFIVGYFLQTGLIKENRNTRIGIYIFSSGIFLNELILMLQGIGAIAYIVIPFANELLWVIALIMVSGVWMINRRSA